MATDTTKITGAADDLSDKLTRGGSAAKTLGAEIANAIKSLDARVTTLETAEPITPPVEPPIEPPTTSGPTGGLITTFSSQQNGRTRIDGIEYGNNTSTKPYAVAKLDDYTLRFEMRQGDRWNYDDSGCDRSQINNDIPPGRIPDGTPFSVAWRFWVEPGGPNTAPWFVTGEWHNADYELPNNWYTSPTWAIEMLQDKWSVVHRYTPKGQDPRPTSPSMKQQRPWTAPQNLERGRWYVFEIEGKTSLSSGYLRVKVDGVQVVNYTGALGYGCGGYLIIGMYRQTNPTTFVAKLKNLTTSWCN